ncbi:MAG: carboxylating nicotinate-nucleotide diphosphorylase [Nitrososphaerota archaeon]|nr:carboxylating nicotinate-nucleotide diphosphorylase [Candidatus Bathyarchaeota archaeon]MDW8048847.1 carboxylating nicotinate-nucleotide diphosphorylase [Nitrososphaerota archaeon]
MARKLQEFLEEDIGLGDITTNAVVPEETHVRAEIVVKEDAVIAGIMEAKVLLQIAGLDFVFHVEDGEEVSSGKVIAEVKGNGRTVLSIERTLLNIMSRMSGIATITRRLVKMLQEDGLNVRIAATRKTAPGLRYFDKRAVMIGGGDPHRFRLDDAFLIKDNHIAVAGSISEAMMRLRKNAMFSKKIEVEVKTSEQAVEAAKLGADIIMIDNMTIEDARKTTQTLVNLGLRDKVLIEISGGINENNLLEYARLGPDIISLGYITHSVKSVDLSLEIVEVMPGKK